MQTKFRLDQPQLEFLSHHRAHGFKDKSAMVRAALDRLKDDVELETLKESAELYADVYEADPELQAWTQAAAEGWPE